MLFYLDNLQIIGKSVSLQCVFHSIRFKVNKRLEQGVAPFFMPVPHFLLNNIDFTGLDNDCYTRMFIFVDNIISDTISLKDYQ